MKKILSIILTVALIVSLGSIVAFAQTRGSNARLFIETPECPQGYVEFAEDTIVGFIESQCEGNMPYSSVTVGRPFAFLDYGSDVYYFPVICDGAIEYIFRVYPSQNTGYDAAISSFLAAELESLAKETSVRRPMKFSSVGNKIIATIGNAEYVLFTYPEDVSDIPLPTNSRTQGSISTIVIDAKSDVGISDIRLG